MHISTLAAALLLPLAAVANPSEALTTTTMTSTMTLTKTITLALADTKTVGPNNATVTLSTPTGSRPASATSPISTGAASTLTGAPMAFVAFAGAAVALFL